MPVTTSAARAMRVSATKHEQNKSVKSAVKTRMTKADKLVASADVEAARQAVKEAISSLDRAEEKGVIHANNASRRKSRLMKKLNRAAAAQAAKAKTQGAA